MNRRKFMGFVIGMGASALTAGCPQIASSCTPSIRLPRYGRDVMVDGRVVVSAHVEWDVGTPLETIIEYMRTIAPHGEPGWRSIMMAATMGPDVPNSIDVVWEMEQQTPVVES